MKDELFWINAVKLYETLFEVEGGAEYDAVASQVAYNLGQTSFRPKNPSEKIKRMLIEFDN